MNGEKKENFISNRCALICVLILLCILILLCVIRIKNEQKSARVPILMYHSVAISDKDFFTSPEMFDKHLDALQNAGYTAISFQDLKDFVCDKSLLKSKTLPEKPIIITFDDGYLNNYLKAYPLLKKHNMPATIFVVGSTIGKSIYSDGLPMEPHFSKEQAIEMVSEGLISIEPHSYNMHQVEGRDTGTIRTNALKLPAESNEEYKQFLLQDLNQWKEATGLDYHIFSYPGGIYDALSEECLKESSLYGSCTTEFEINTIRKGHAEDLWAMSRFSVHDLTAEELIALLGNQYTE